MSAGETGDARRFAPAAARNRDAIRDALRSILPSAGLLLEVASGSGEHAVHLAEAFPHLRIQPTDRDPQALASIDAWAAWAGLANLLPGLPLDAESDLWPVDRADAVFCANMIHIAPWSATLGLCRGAARLLPPGAPLVLYGPFDRAGVPLAPGNAAFDAGLRERDPAWGVRALDDVAEAAVGFAAPAVVELPANNILAVFRRLGGTPA